MSEDLGTTLLTVARDALQGYLRDQEVPKFDGTGYPAAASEPHGSFVTLKRHGALRGCIGTLYPRGSLLEDIVDNAISAAIHDSRFAKVTLDELKELTLEISVLTPPKRLTTDHPAALLAALQPGVHGVILHYADCRATYLPQVWQEIEGKEAFLESLCRKGGMPRGAWRQPSAEIYLYEAEVYGPIAAVA